MRTQTDSSIRSCAEISGPLYFTLPFFKATLLHMCSKRKGKIRSTADLRTASYIRLREPKFGLRIESNSFMSQLVTDVFTSEHSIYPDSLNS